MTVYSRVLNSLQISSVFFAVVQACSTHLLAVLLVTLSHFGACFGTPKVWLWSLVEDLDKTDTMDTDFNPDPLIYAMFWNSNPEVIPFFHIFSNYLKSGPAYQLRLVKVRIGVDQIVCLQLFFGLSNMGYPSGN